MKLQEMNDKELTKHWNKVASDQLLNKRIVSVRYMTESEAFDMGWSGRPIAFQLEDGLWVYPSSDDEGNEGGALFTSHDSEPTLPLLR